MAEFGVVLLFVCTKTSLLEGLLGSQLIAEISLYV